MRVLVPILFSVLAVIAANAQTSASAVQAPDNLNIPAQFSKTIDTNKCKPGDPVEMKTLEPVLIGNGLVMPEGAKLHGTILGAASKQNDQPSWVVLVLERAEWKQHTVPLHAFVASQITLKVPAVAPRRAFDDPMPGSVRRRNSGIIPTAPGRVTSTAPSHPLQDALVEGNGTAFNYVAPPDDLRIAQGKNGIVFLVSPKAHLKLSAGTMFMFRNHATAIPEQAVPLEAVAQAHTERTQ